MFSDCWKFEPKTKVKVLHSNITYWQSILCYKAINGFDQAQLIKDKNAHRQLLNKVVLGNKLHLLRREIHKQI